MLRVGLRMSSSGKGRGDGAILPPCGFAPVTRVFPVDEPRRGTVRSVRAVLLAAVVLLLVGCGGEPTPIVFPPRVPTPTAPDFVAPPRGSVVFAGPAGK